MARSMIGTEIVQPEWLSSGMRSGMIAQFRTAMGTIEEGTRVLSREGVVTLDHTREPECGCLVPHGGGGHIGSGVLLNPHREYIGDNSVALLYEGLMYVGRPDGFFMEEQIPHIQVGQAKSQWWVMSNLEPGWYDNQGQQVEYRFNPQYLSNEVEIMALDVANGTRLLGQMMRVDGLPYARTLNGPVATDRDGDLERWVIASYILPRAEHRAALPEPVAVEWVDPTVDMTHQQKITRLNERFTALTRATAAMAVDEDWCGNYEEACEAMGLAESDYTKEEEEEDVTYSVRVRLSYHISASAWDDILNSRFGGSHDIQDGTDIDSLVTVTVTQAGDFEQDSHDWDDILSSAGYDDYDEIEIENWVSI